MQSEVMVQRKLN